MSLNLYYILTLLMVLTAAFSYINLRFIKLPTTIGVMLISLICSLVMIWLGRFHPSWVQWPISAISSLDFETLLMRMMLSFLLFAGAIHVDLKKLRKEIWPIATYSSLGMLISTAVIGIAMFYTFHLFGLSIPFIYCLLFGAWISPTDPIAVMGILKKARISSSLEIKITGEALLNDGVAVVVFITLMDFMNSGPDNISFVQTAGLFFREAGGGAVWGILIGYLGFYLLRSIDHYQVEVLITIALVMGGYLFASRIHVSGPLAMVTAGIIIGNKGKREAMSELTQDYVNKFWELIDEILNALLFLLIGLEMIVFSFDLRTIWIGLAAILIVLAGRFISVVLPTLFFSFRGAIEKHIIPILTWGGLRGGISVALALSQPRSEYRDTLIAITYIVVVFSILVQGLTIGKLAKKLTLSEGPR